jgi:hypothetical protein
VRGTRVWAGLLGLKAVVVEDVYCGDHGEVVVAVRPRWRERDRCGVCGGVARASTSGMGDGVGVRSISGRRLRSWRRRRRECAAPVTGWSSARCRGRAIGRGSPAALTTRSRGWRCTARSPRSLS